MMSKKYLFVFFLLLVFSCQDVPIGQFTIVDSFLEEKDLIPEGIAIDKRTGIRYIGSTYKRKIIQQSQLGEVSDFIPQEQNGIWSPVGMEVDEKRDLLWVNMAHANEVMPLINPDSVKDWMTNVSVFSISQQKLVKKYSIPDSAFFNDLTVSPNGDVFITECVGNKLYIIDNETDSLQLFIDLAGFNFPNGITYDKVNKLLFVATIEGILRVDVSSKNHQLIEVSDSVDARFIDGLALHQDYLIGHQSSKISKFYLNTNRTAITKMELLDSGEKFDASTTGELDKQGSYHYIVNSQISSGVDYQNRTIKPLDSLEKVIIRKRKL